LYTNTSQQTKTYKPHNSQLPQKVENTKVTKQYKCHTHIDQPGIDFALNHVWIGVHKVKPLSVRVIMGETVATLFSWNKRLCVTVCCIVE
jgi:hypothetical protein